MPVTVFQHVKSVQELLYIKKNILFKPEQDTFHGQNYMGLNFLLLSGE